MLSRKGCVVWGVVSGLCGIEVFSRRDKMNKEKKKNVADKWNTKCLRQIEEEKKKTPCSYADASCSHTPPINAKNQAGVIVDAFHAVVEYR